MGEAVVAHPLLVLFARPVAAQPDLDEAVAGDRARLDEPAHRGAVAGEVAVEDRSAVSACASKWIMTTLPKPWWSATATPAGQVIEWSPPMMTGMMPRLVISRTRFVDGGLRQLPHAVADDRVAVVDDLEVVEDLDLQVEVVGAGVVGAGAHRPRAEAGARTVGGVVVPRGADDRDVGLPLVELRRLGEQRPHPERRGPHIRGSVELLAHAGRDVALRCTHVSHG